LQSTDDTTNCEVTDQLRNRGLGNIQLIDKTHLEALDITCHDDIITFIHAADSTRDSIAIKKVRSIIFKNRLRGGLIGVSALLVGAGIEAIQKSGEPNILPIYTAILTPFAFLIGYGIGYNSTYTYSSKEQIIAMKNRFKILELDPSSILEDTDTTIIFKIGDKVGTFLKSQIKLSKEQNKTIIEVSEYLYYQQFNI
jgi:hypothetical protein